MKWVLILLIGAVVVAGGGFWWWSQQVLPMSFSSTTKIAFVIVKNQTAGQIISQLAQKGLIRSQLAARLFLLISGLERKLQAGSFVLSPNQTLAAIFQSLTGPPADVWVTIPEGWRREQIAARMQSSLSPAGTGFNAQDFLTSTATMEGQLFPDTYLIPISATADRVVQIMTANFAAKVNLSLPSDRQTLILASLVEREAISEVDRPVIAGILQKRLRAGWPLQVDAAVQYALGNTRDWWPQVTDTKIPSPYNTYLYPGLPPGPIANPGLAAINAAKNPQSSPYWFYLHSPDGAVHYAQTIQEQAVNIDKYLRP